jgi:hypothetical protein
MLPAVFGAAARAADTNNPPMAPQDYFEGGTNSYNNWVDFSGGAFLTHGNRAQAQGMQSLNNGGFGGINDLHVQGNVFTNTTLTLDGRGIYDQHDYNINLRLEHPEKWFLQFHADNYRTWSDDIGGFFPPTGAQYYGPNGNTPLALDRGEYSFLGGLTLDNLPSITFQYTHSYRTGNEDSTIWGPVHPSPLSSPATVQGLAASLYNVDETVDAFDLNAKKNLWHTDLGAGLHFEHADLNDGLDSPLFPGEPVAEDVSANQKNTYNLFSANATGEKWIKDHVFVSAGGMVANLDDNFSGSQIYGSSFGAPYSPAFGSGLGYNNLVGNSHLQEYVMDLNLLTIPIKTLDIIPAIRASKESWSSDSTGIGTLSTFPSEPFNSQSSEDVIDVCESLDLRYTGFTNWVFSAGGRWDESSGNLNQFGGVSQVDGIGVPAVTNYTDNTSLLQKYSAGASWYPLSRLAVDFGGYYKNDRYNYTASADSTPDGDTYPGYFTIQKMETYDGNCRVTLHLLRSLSLTSRYEYQLSTIDTTPDAASGLSEQQTSRMHSHIIGQNISWVPWSRLSVQAGFSYVLSTTATPASQDTAAIASQATPPTAAAILNAENNYWTLNFSPSLVLDDKTDLNLDYFYYQADDYQDNSPGGVPLGAGSREQAVTATLTRRINPHLRVSLKYGYYNYKDALTGGNSNFQGQLIMAGLQYRF